MPDEITEAPEVVENPAEPELVEAPETGEPTWALAQDEWNRVNGFINAAAPVLQHVAQLLQEGQSLTPQAQEQAPPVALPEIDPFDPNSVQTYVDALLEQRVAAAIQNSLSPYESVLGMVASREGEDLAKREFEKIASEVGEFDQEAAFAMASGLIERGMDPGEAIREAGTYAREWEKRIATKAVEDYKASLQTISDAPQEQTGGAVATEIEGVPKGRGRYEVAIQRALDRRSPITPTG